MAHFRDVMAAGVHARLALMLGHNRISTVAAAGSSQGTATLLEVNYGLLLTTGPNTGVRLRSAVGQAMHVFCNLGPDTALIYPDGLEAFNGGTPASAFQVPAGATVILVPSEQAWLVLSNASGGGGGPSGSFLPLAGGTISGTAPGTLIINRNAVLPPPAAGIVAMLRMIGGDGENPALLVDGFGLGGLGSNALMIRVARGTGAAPSAILNGDSLGNIAWRGYGATGYSSAAAARVTAAALENFTDTAQGTRLLVQTNPAGSTAIVTQAAIGPGLTVGAPAAPAGGTLFGDLNAQRLLVNGVPVGTGASGGGVAEAPSDGTYYGRQNTTWQRVLATIGGTISGTAPGTLTINRNAVLPAPPSGVVTPLWTIANNSENSAIVMDAFGGNNALIMRRANGSSAAPSRVLAGDDLGNLAWRPYGLTGWAAAAAAQIAGVAAETFTDIAQGGQLVFRTNPIGSTSLTTQAAIGPGLTVGVPTAPAGGMLFGDVNASGRIMVNGVPVGGGGGGGIAEAPSDGTSYSRQNAGWTNTPIIHGATISGTAPGTLTINRNPVLPAAPAGVVAMLRMIGGDGENPALMIDGFGLGGTGSNALISRVARGTGGAPSAILNGDSLGNIAWRGYGATGYGNAAAARLTAAALENFTDTAQGAQLLLQTNPVGSIIAVTQAAIGPGLMVGVPTAPAGGMLFGDVNASGRIMVNGVAVSAGGGISDAPSDGTYYGRINASWQHVAGFDTVGTNLTATGVDRASALALAADFNEVLTVLPGTGVVLRNNMNIPGQKCRIAAYGANDLLVYPLAGQTFFSGGVSNGVDQPLTLMAGNCALFETATATTVYMVSST